MDAPRVKTVGELKELLSKYPDDMLLCTSVYNNHDEYDVDDDVGAMKFNDEYFYIGKFFGVPS